jgi:hypothetical protein
MKRPATIFAACLFFVTTLLLQVNAQCVPTYNQLQKISCFGFECVGGLLPYLITPITPGHN